MPKFNGGTYCIRHCENEKIRLREDVRIKDEMV